MITLSRGYLAGACALFGAIWLVSLGQHLLVAAGRLPRPDMIWIANVDFERSVFTWASGMLLFQAGLMLWLIGQHVARTSRPDRRWTVLAALFILLSADEVLSFHERAAAPLRPLVEGNPYLFHSWVVVALPMVVLLGLYFLSFLRTLPGGIRWRVVLAGALYVGGAIGMEMLNGQQMLAHGVEAVPYVALMHLEEAMEAGGILLFVSALSRYAEMQGGGARRGFGGLHPKPA